MIHIQKYQNDFLALFFCNYRTSRASYLTSSGLRSSKIQIQQCEREKNDESAYVLAKFAIALLVRDLHHDDDCFILYCIDELLLVCVFGVGSEPVFELRCSMIIRKELLTRVLFLLYSLRRS